MNFPVLKTGAVAQYPLQRVQQFSTETVHFLNGTQQRFRLFGRGLRRWAISLDSLDEQELSALLDFVDTQGSSTFPFIDPLTGDTVPQCAIATSSVDAVLTDEDHGKSMVLIEELG